MISRLPLIKSEHLHFCPTLPRFRDLAPPSRPTVPAVNVTAACGPLPAGVAVPAPRLRLFAAACGHCLAYVMPCRWGGVGWGGVGLYVAALMSCRRPVRLVNALPCR